MNESSPAWPIGDDAESVQAFDDAVVEGLRRVEKSLWRAQTRYDSAYMNEALALTFGCATRDHRSRDHRGTAQERAEDDVGEECMPGYNLDRATHTGMITPNATANAGIQRRLGCQKLTTTIAE